MPAHIKALGPFPCPHCPRVYEKKRALTQHAAIHDPRTKKFACPWDGCGHRTRQKSNLKTHMKTQHMDIKDIICPKCGHATGDPARAHRHQQSEHGYISRKTRKCRYTISDTFSFSSSSGSEASLPTTPTAQDKPDLDNWQSYPFDNSFASIQAKPLYPATEAIPALSYPAPFDFDSLFSTESGYDWSSPVANVDSPVSSPDIWASWASTPEPTFPIEVLPTSFDWSLSPTPFDLSPSLEQERVQFIAPSPGPLSSYSPDSAASHSPPYTEQSLDQFFSFALPAEAYPSMDGAFSSPSPDGSYIPSPSSEVYGAFSSPSSLQPFAAPDYRIFSGL